VGVGFVLLTHSTPFYILSDIGNEAWPPEFGGDKLASFKVAGVAGCLMVVAALENRFTEGIVVGDIDATQVDENPGFYLPVRES
jgi:hypothetical protein